MMKSPVLATAAFLAIMPWSCAASAQALGVPVCDEFLTKYEACVAKMPAQQQAAFKLSLDQMRTGWTGMATNPQTKPALEGICKQMTDSMKAAMASYGCQW
jgi:hypothetical protein